MSDEHEMGGCGWIGGRDAERRHYAEEEVKKLKQRLDRADKLADAVREVIETCGKFTHPGLLLALEAYDAGEEE